MPYHYPTLTYRGPPKRTYDEGPGGQVKIPSQPYGNRRFQAPHTTVPVDRKSSGSSSINTAIMSSKAGWWKRKSGSSNEININATTNKDKNLPPPQGEGHRGPKGKRGNDIDNNANVSASNNKKFSLPRADTYEECTNKGHGLPSPRAQEHKGHAAFQNTADGREKKVKISTGSDVIMDDSPSAQVPAFHHLVLLESLGAPENELKAEYLRERRRLAKLYRLQPDQSEDEVAAEYMENRTKGMEAEAARREQESENNGRGGHR
ncbi:hypothetical protein DV737_g5371, partial [Chaetothyriales sp. CBS 132003]